VVRGEEVTGFDGLRRHVGVETVGAFHDSWVEFLRLGGVRPDCDDERAVVERLGRERRRCRRGRRDDDLRAVDRDTRRVHGSRVDTPLL
jgi:hypothetical protein